jgi:hypothetical protein
MLKKKFNLNPILHNRIVLYFIALLALLDMIYFLNANDLISFSTLILVGILASFFSKNMIVILVIALTITHILKYGNAAYVSEGMENQEEKEDEEDEEDSKEGYEEKSKDSTEKNTDSTEKKSKGKSDEKIEYADLKSEYADFEGIQGQIMDSMKKLDPLLSRAEGFIERFEKFKHQEGK